MSKNLTKMEESALSMAWAVFHSCLENDMYIGALDEAVEFLKYYSNEWTDEDEADFVRLQESVNIDY